MKFRADIYSMATSRPFNWRRALKLTGVIVAAVLVLFSVTSWILFRQRNALVLEQIHTYLEKSQSGQWTIGAIDLRLFRNFPDLTLALDSIRCVERADTLDLTGDPVFQADRIFVAVGIWSLLQGHVEVSEVSVIGGQVNLTQDANGQWNAERIFTKPGRRGPVKTPSRQPTKPAVPAPRTTPPAAAPQSREPMRVNLETMTLRDVLLRWKPHRQSDRNSLHLQSLDVELTHQDAWVAILLESQWLLDTVQLGDFRLPSSRMSFETKGHFQRDSAKLTIDKAILALDIFTVSASGTYAHRDRRKLDVRLHAATQDLPLLEKILQPAALKGNRDLLRKGELYLDGHVFGELVNRPPQFDITFGARNISFRVPGMKGAFDGLGFEGRFQSGGPADYSGAVLQLSQLKGQVPGGFVRGDIRISNLVRPWLNCAIQTRLDLDGYDKVFRLQRLRNLEGVVTANVTFDGPMRIPWPGAKGPRARFDGSFSVDSLALRVDGHPEGFRDIFFRGTCSSGANADQSLAVLDIPGFRAKIPGGQAEGRLRLVNFLEPVLSYRLRAEADLTGYDSLFAIKTLRDLKGHASADLRFDGRLSQIGTHAMDSSRSSSIRLDSVSFGFTHHHRTVRELSGHLINQNNLADLDVSLRYGDSDIQAKASVENLMHRIFKNERLVRASGKVQSSQLFTRDLIFDSLRAPQVDDRLSNLSFEFLLSNVLPVEEADFNEQKLQFDIRNLKAHLDKLPDIRDFDAKGTFRRNPQGIYIGLNSLRLTPPQGSLALSGNLELPEKRQLVVDTRIKLGRFPWNYVRELVAEIQEGREPSQKQLSPAAMDRVSADLDIRSSIRTYPFDFHRLEIRHSRAAIEQADGRQYAADSIDAIFQPLYFAHPPNEGSITGWRTVRGTSTLKKLRVPGLIDLNLSLQATGYPDTLVLDFTSTSRKARKEDGTILLTRAEEGIAIGFHYQVTETPVDALVARFSQKEFLKGDISYTLDLATKGSSWAEVRGNLGGTIDIAGDSLDLVGIDVDDALTKFEKSQKFNLTDLGAVVLIGPVGIVATKGSDFVALATLDVSNRKHTPIRKLVARWKLDHLVLQSTDVAFATPKNRIAINGAIDFNRDSIPGIQVAVVDKNGCSLMDQKLYGKFSAVQTGKLNVAKTLLGSVINFVDALVGKDCQPVYQGEVKAPNAAKK